MLGNVNGAELSTLQARMRSILERLRRQQHVSGFGVYVCPSNNRLLVDPQVLAAFAQPRAHPIGGLVC